MGWLGAFLFKRGAGFLVPYLIPIIIGTLLGGTSLTAWLGGWAEWRTALLGFFLLGATIWLASVIISSTSRTVRIACALAIAVLWTISGTLAGYWEGRAIEAALTEAKVEQARKEVHAEYKSKTDAERTRLEQNLKAAEEAGQKASSDWFEERKRLRAEVERAREEASKSATAKRPALGLDSIDRINRMRHDPKRARTVPGDSGETQAR